METKVEHDRGLAAPSATYDTHAPTIATQASKVRRSHHFVHGRVRVSQKSVHKSHPELSFSEVLQELPLLHATSEMWR